MGSASTTVGGCFEEESAKWARAAGCVSACGFSAAVARRTARSFDGAVAGSTNLINPSSAPAVPIKAASSVPLTTATRVRRTAATQVRGNLASRVGSFIARQPVPAEGRKLVTVDVVIGRKDLRGEEFSTECSSSRPAAKLHESDNHYRQHDKADAKNRHNRHNLTTNCHSKEGHVLAVRGVGT